MFDRVVKDINCDKVLVDDKEAVYKATSHLIKSGRKKIALVSTISNLTVGKSRIAGYKQALNENGIEFLESYVVSSSEEGIKKETDLFLSNNQTEAIIALDIQSSLSGLKSVKEKGLEIPKDVAIIGYSSERTASHLTPELSTISQNGIEIGRKATKLLIDRLKFPEKPFENIVVASKIQNRQSS
jgi:LacI family transcriptional regulator